MCGFGAAALAEMSPAKLVWIHERHQAREIQAEIRWLLNATAAANTGANGGDAAESRLRALQLELKRVAVDSQEPMANRQPKCQTPRSQEEFDQMMKDES